MPCYMLVKLFFVILLIDCAYTACPKNWTHIGLDCCSPTFGLNSTIPMVRLTHGLQYPDTLTVWNDSSHSSLAIETHWDTLNVLWGQTTGTKSEPYQPGARINAVKIFYQAGVGLYGLQFHTSKNFSPVFGLAISTYVNVTHNGHEFTGWGFVTEPSELLQSISACFLAE